MGIVLEDGSRVAIDWVTGRSYSSARRRLNVQSVQRKGGKCAAAPYPSVAVRDRGHWKGVAGSEWVREVGRGKTAPMERCSPWSAPQHRTVRAGRSPKNTSVTRKQLTSRPDHLWPELWKSMVKNAKLKEKQKWSEEKIHLENARRLRGIYFIDPEDKEFKETIKNARKKLETSVAPAMPC